MLVCAPVSHELTKKKEKEAQSFVKPCVVAFDLEVYYGNHGQGVLRETFLGAYVLVYLRNPPHA